MISWPSVRLNTHGAPRYACIFLLKPTFRPFSTTLLTHQCIHGNHHKELLSQQLSNQTISSQNGYQLLEPVDGCFWCVVPMNAPKSIHPSFQFVFWFKLFVCRLCSHFIQECFYVLHSNLSIFWKEGIMLLAVGEEGCQDFWALLGYPWARFWTPICSQRAHGCTLPSLVCSQEPPPDPRRENGS